MNDELQHLKNLGKTSAQWLHAVGIHSASTPLLESAFQPGRRTSCPLRVVSSPSRRQSFHQQKHIVPCKQPPLSAKAHRSLQTTTISRTRPESRHPHHYRHPVAGHHFDLALASMVHATLAAGRSSWRREP